MIDLDGDGRADALAQDADADGMPDLDAAGQPQIIAGSQGYRVAEGVDATVPEMMAWIGGLLGVPVLVGIGAAWKGARFGRIFMNTVMSVQVARQRLKDKGEGAALAILDETLAGNQLAQTAGAVAKAKQQLGVATVTGTTAAPDS